MKSQVVIPAAGLGRRIKSDIPKPLILLKHKPIIVYSLEVFEKSASIDSVILVVNQDHINAYASVIEKYHLKKVKKIIPGGLTRCDSVYRGLKNVDEDTEIILIHDGARPLVSIKTVEDAVELLSMHEAVVVAVPVKPTIKRVDKKEGVVLETLNRAEPWEAQTPQIFRKDVLERAYQNSGDISPTDEAALVERLGVKVKIVEGEYTNIKITTVEDLAVAEAFLNLPRGV